MPTLFRFMIICLFLYSHQLFAGSDSSLVLSQYCITDTRNFDLVINSPDCIMPPPVIINVVPPSTAELVQEFKNQIAERDAIISQRVHEKFARESAEYIQSFAGKICRVQAEDNQYTTNTKTDFTRSDLRNLKTGSLVAVVATNVHIIDGEGHHDPNGVKMKVIRSVQNSRDPLNARQGEYIYDYQVFSIGLGHSRPGALVDCYFAR